MGKLKMGLKIIIANDTKNRLEEFMIANQISEYDEAINALLSIMDAKGTL